MENAQSQTPVKNTALWLVQKVKDMIIPLVEQTKNWTGKWRDDTKFLLHFMNTIIFLKDCTNKNSIYFEQRVRFK